MITIPVQVSNELASRILPLQDRLPEIIELGLRQITGDNTVVDTEHVRTQLIEVLASTGIVTFPTPKRRRQASRRLVIASGPLASAGDRAGCRPGGRPTAG